MLRHAPWALLLLVPVAAAHGDVVGIDETVHLEPGTALELQRDIHFHRLVGTVSADDDVEVSIAGPKGTETVAGPGRDLRPAHLVACCRGETWSTHTIVVRNVGTQPTDVHVDLVLLHDDLGVVAANAEGGAAVQTLLILLAITGIPAWLATHRGGHDPRRARLGLRLGWGGLGAAWAIGASLALVGMVQAGTGPLVGARIATSAVLLEGGFVNAFMVVMLLGMVLWTVGLSGWAMAQRHSAEGPWTQRLGYTLAAGPLIVGTSLGLEYDAGWIALMLALPPLAITLAGMHWRRGDAPRPAA